MYAGQPSANAQVQAVLARNAEARAQQALGEAQDAAGIITSRWADQVVDWVGVRWSQCCHTV